MVRVWARQTDSAQRISADGRKEKEPKSDEKVKGKKREKSKEAERGDIGRCEKKSIEAQKWKRGGKKNMYKKEEEEKEMYK